MLDFIRDIFASFRQTSLERVKSPVLGAFVFSWLAFNWKTVAIVFFSSKEMESRIISIKGTYTYWDYLIWPLIITAVICLSLPVVNKIVAKIQNKPNADTMELYLDAKISIAEKQVTLADKEARKKLASKREERNIESNIRDVKKSNISLIAENKKLNTKVADKEQEIFKLTADLATEHSKTEQHDTIKKRYEDEISKLKNEIDANNTLILELRVKSNSDDEMIRKMNEELSELKNDVIDLESQKKYIADRLSNLDKNVKKLVNTFDGLFAYDLGNDEWPLAWSDKLDKMYLKDFKNNGIPRS